MTSPIPNDFRLRDSLRPPGPVRVRSAALRLRHRDPGACCGACECDTGCLSRPHFYCGMVLTDDQLNDLAQWVRRRSALHRYVEGWGVVRGLAVRCDPAVPAR